MNTKQVWSEDCKPYTYILDMSRAKYILDKVFGFKLPWDPLFVVRGVSPTEIRGWKRKYILLILLAAAKKSNNTELAQEETSI